jgi:hypothetical protein
MPKSKEMGKGKRDESWMNVEGELEMKTRKMWMEENCDEAKIKC